MLNDESVYIIHFFFVRVNAPLTLHHSHVIRVANIDTHTHSRTHENIIQGSRHGSLITLPLLLSSLLPHSGSLHQ